MQLHQHRRRQQRYQVDDLDHRVERRACGVLQRVAHGVAYDGRLVGIGAFAAVNAVFDGLLGIVPRAAGCGHEYCQQLAGEYDARQRTAQCLNTQEHADDEGSEYGDKRKADEFLLRRACANADHLLVIGLHFALHQAGDAELLAHFVHD